MRPAGTGAAGLTLGVTMDGPEPVRLNPHSLALLRGGPLTALKVAALALLIEGSAHPARRGTLRTSGVATRSGSPLEKAVHVSLHRRPAGIRDLLEQPRVRTSLAELRAELIAAGLLRGFPRGRTRAARRTLDDLRAQLPLPGGREGLSTEDILYAVALHGDEALTVLAPRFAQDAGLLGRGGAADGERSSPNPGGGGHGAAGAAF
ncbi:TIGR04222 domain-containing membrane protein [Streptomyces sp. NPDC088747]|uniref:TIGR04222 domain-containing membrane protein n=1 Tax=Streptomyces sp. NPDC088747 TaxID=3365886 RepID=UPI00381D0F98